MDHAHDTALTDLMRDLCDVGVASIELRVLLRWFERTNMTKGIWRDMQQRFERVLLERKKKSFKFAIAVADRRPDGFVDLLRSCRCRALRSDVDAG
jgi:hypothetical protein